MKLKRLIAENVYSFYKIDIILDKHDLTQVTGINKDEERQVNIDEESIASSNVNGVGKTNIYNCIIQALYSRDIYKTKKSFLKNMFTRGKFSITLELEIEQTQYKITYMADECILFKEGNQFISGRASVTEFFENLIPFELFLNLTYISSTITFPFFTATPTQQKQFIELVFSDLTKFKESIPKLKDRLSDELKLKNTIETQIEIYIKQADIEIDKYIKVSELPEQEDLSAELYTLQARSTKLESIKRDINLLNKKLEKPLIEVIEPEVNLAELQERLGKGKGIIEVTTTEIKKLEKLSTNSVCTLCGSEIDIATNKKLLKEKQDYLLSLQDTLKTVREDIKEAQAQQALYEKYQEKVKERKEIKDKLLNVSYSAEEFDGLLAQQLKIKQAQEAQSNKLKEVQAQRETAITHNTKIDLDTIAKKIAQGNLEELAQQNPDVLITNIKVLIEICDKVILNKQIPKRLEVLERFINIELVNFTSQYQVKLDMDKNKIKPSVIKNSKVYPVENISTGEKARINISLIFAIRNILTRLNKEVYNINLLYVDELLGVLDFSGKHLLLETLKTYNLNIFLVSHDYTFPDIELLNLVKKDNKTKVLK